MQKRNIPGWVNWIAQDANGNWWGFSEEPQQFHQGWYENEVGKNILLASAPPNPDWQLTLQQVTGKSGHM